jgi:hypothetical protein
MDDLLWVEVGEQPYLMSDYETFIFILDELGKGKPYTPEMMKCLKDPRLKRKLLEEICRSRANA